MTKRIKTALVTGASARIGRQIALDLGEDGWRVVVHFATSDEQAADVVEAIRSAGGEAEMIQGDLGEADAGEKIIAGACDLAGPLTLLVNNASRFERDELDNIEIEGWDQHLNVNLRAPVFLSQHFAAQLPDGEKGNIVNLIDERVWRLTPSFFSYTISKSGLWAATKTLAQSLAPRIRVNAIGPGPALPSSRMAGEEFDKQCNLMPLQVGTTPKEISSALKFILSAPAMTGQMIALDGGQHLGWETPDFIEVKE